MKKYFRGLTFYILIFIIILYFVRIYWQQPQEIVEFDFTQLISEVQEGNISTINMAENRISGTLLDGTSYESYIPEMMGDSFGDYVFNLAVEEGAAISLEGIPPLETPWFVDILPSVFMILIFVVFWFVFMQNSQGGGSKVMSFGKSKARLHKPDEGKIINFSDSSDSRSGIPADRFLVYTDCRGQSFYMVYFRTLYFCHKLSCV